MSFFSDSKSVLFDNFAEKPKMKMNSKKKQKHGCLIHNQALPSLH